MSELRRYRRLPNQYVVAIPLRLDTDGFSYRKWGGEQQCKPGDQARHQHAARRRRRARRRNGCSYGGVRHYCLQRAKWRSIINPTRISPTPISPITKIEANTPPVSKFCDAPMIN